MGDRGRAAVQLVIAAAWVLAIAALVAVLVGCGLRIARRFIRLLSAVGDLFAAPAVLDGVHRAEAELRPPPSVLEPLAQARKRRDSFRRQGAEARERRRLARLDLARDLIAPWRKG